MGLPPLRRPRADPFTEPPSGMPPYLLPCKFPTCISKCSSTNSIHASLYVPQHIPYMPSYIFPYKFSQPPYMFPYTNTCMLPYIYVPLYKLLTCLIHAPDMFIYKFPSCPSHSSIYVSLQAPYIPPYMFPCKKVKSSLAKSPQRRNESGQLSTTCSNATEVAKWATPSCSRPHRATDNGIRYGRSKWLVAPPPSWAVPPERIHEQNKLVQPLPESTLQYSACEATTLPIRPLRAWVELTNV